MERYLLKFLNVFAWAFRLMRVDFGQLQAIVAVKLLTDNRRQHISYRRASQEEKGNAFLMTLFFYSIFGVFIAFAILALPSFILSMIVFFSYLMVMVAMTLITDFSSILLDTSDNTIILPRPVDGKTLFVARTTHILLYLGQLTIALSLAPMVAVWVEYGVTQFLLFVVGILLSIMSSVFITNGCYLLILQFASEEKLKNIINYFQIIMAVSIMGGYQILPRILERLDINSFVFEVQWWHFLLPPVWIAAGLEAVYKGLTDTGHLGLALFALVIPPTGLFLVNTYLTPVFNRKLGMIGSGVEGKEKTKSEKSSFIDSVSRWITFSQLERGAFDLIYKILGRDRKFKLKIYPTFGYIAIFGLLFLMRGQKNLEDTWSNLPYTHLYLMLMYMTFMVLQIALYEIPYNDDFKASWVYFSTPVDSPGEILSGMLKAIFVRLFLPGYFVIAVFVFFIWGNQVLDDLLYGLFNNFLMLTIIATVNKRHLPLSMAPHLRSQTGNFLRSLLTFVIIAVLALSHYLLTKKPFLLLGAIPFQLALIYFLVRRYKRTTWDQISS
jgi:ABC-2 type transport system permease protein